MALLRLLSKLSLDGTQFRQELGQSERRAKGFSRNVSRSTSAVGRQLAGMAGGFFGIAAFSGAIRNLNSYSASLVNLSKELGVSIETLQEWDFAAGQTNTTLDAFVQTLRFLPQRIQLAITNPTGEAGAAFKQLGVNVAEFAKLGRQAQLERLFSAFTGAGGTQEAMAAMQRIMGETSTRLIPLIQQYDQLIERARELGIVVDAGAVTAMAEAGDQLDTLMKQARGGLGAVFGSGLFRAGRQHFTDLFASIMASSHVADTRVGGMPAGRAGGMIASKIIAQQLNGQEIANRRALEVLESIERNTSGHDL